MTGAELDLWRALQREYGEVVVGELWLSEIRSAVSLTVRSYPPAVYAETGIWNEQALEDVVSDVTTTQLLDDAQIHYIIDAARTLTDARRLLRRNVKWTLARRRQRTVVDNLLDRCREMRAEAVEADVAPAVPSRSATDEELAEAVRLVAAMPRLAVHGGDRAPVIFTGDVLRNVLVAVAGALPAGFADRDLSIIFERVLTPHLPNALVTYDGNYDEPDLAVGVEEQLMVRETAAEMHAALTPEQRIIMAMKLANVADADVATHLGRSRPTVASRRNDASRELRTLLSGLPSHLQDAALVDLAERLDRHLPSHFRATSPPTL